MPHSLDQVLPSLEALGIWSYWIIGAASLLEAFFPTGVFVPGTLAVDAGGILVQQGALDFFDLVWFVAVGSFLGGELGFWAGALARRGMNTRWRPETSPSYRKAERLFGRYGGLSLVLGRFAGPVSGLVPFGASVAGMDRRRFVIWNAASGFPYALFHVGLGYLLGDVMTWLGPIATRVALVVGGLLLVVGLLWWLTLRIVRLLPFAVSVLKSIAHAIATNPDVEAWAGRHPRSAAFVAHRLDASRASGLTATLIGAALLYVLIVWAGSVLDFLMADPIVQVDERLANLIHATWSPGLLKAAAHVTALGDWRVVSCVVAATLAALWILRRPGFMLGLAVSVAGNVTTVILLKRVFHRPRPELAFFAETTDSFPSGHAAVSVTLYGMLFFLAWRLRLLGPVAASILAATLALAIGLSRLYLIEHYLSDVLNGWLVGSLWLLIGIAITEWWRETREDTAAQPRLPNLARAAGLGAVTILSIAAGWQLVTYDKARNVRLPPQVDETVTDVAALFPTGLAPNTTESITGTPLEPVNVIILTRKRAALESAMAQAGWARAAQPTLRTLTQAGWALLTASGEDRAPVTPYFWRGQPNDVAFQKPSDDHTIRKRHHARFWRTDFVTPDGLRAFVGAASFDDGMDWQLLHHIDPNIDAERDRLVGDLQEAGVVASLRTPRLSTARLGQSVAGDPWFTDGRAALMILQ